MFNCDSEILAKKVKRKPLQKTFVTQYLIWLWLKGECNPNNFVTFER